MPIAATLIAIMPFRRVLSTTNVSNAVLQPPNTGPKGAKLNSIAQSPKNGYFLFIYFNTTQ